MGANLERLADAPSVVIGLALGLMAVKFALLYGLSMLFDCSPRTGAGFATALCQGGEFAFVLFAAAAAIGVLASGVAQPLVLAVTLSMLLSPPLFWLHDRLAARARARAAQPEFDAIDDPGKPVIIAGYGRVGQIVSRVLHMCGIPFTALELSYQQVDFVRRFGSKVYYGDASRLELLQAAKAAEAKLLVLAIDDVEASVRTAAVARRHFPHLLIVARARNRTHAFRLRDLGVRMILRETFPSSLDMARLALLRLGLSAAATEGALSLFRRHDEEMLEAQYAVHHDEALLIQTSKQAAEQLRELFDSDPAAMLAAPKNPAAAPRA
jgi:glutathione-regulated potassium-efflux system ancillary protein KefC/glutathione-regulated potassium-efflux system protein KefB